MTTKKYDKAYHITIHMDDITVHGCQILRRGDVKQGGEGQTERMQIVRAWVRGDHESKERRRRYAVGSWQSASAALVSDRGLAGQTS